MDTSGGLSFSAWSLLFPLHSGQNNSVMDVCGTGDGGVTGDISNYTINWVYKPTDITGGYHLVQTKFSSVPSFSFWFRI